LLESFAFVGLALPATLLSVGLLRIMALAESGLAASLLGGDDADGSTHGAIPAKPARHFDPDVALSLHLAFTALVAVLMAVIWLGSGGGYFWPAWVWLGICAPLGIHVVVRRALRAPAARGRSVRIHAEATALIGGWLTLV